jgi:ribosomal protein RSM22 (predicted rRNA methylase)
MQRINQIPDKLNSKIVHYIETHQINNRQIQKSTLSLSNSYQNQGQHTDIWLNQNFIDSYICYFYPLNYLRFINILEQIKSNANAFMDIDLIYDFGSGLGTAIDAFTDSHLFKESQKYISVEASEKALRFQKKWLADKVINLETRQTTITSALNENIEKNSLAIFSYSLNEVEIDIKKLFLFDHIIILEPSTQLQSRQLLKIRQTLIENNFQILAPCTHQGLCPILEKSQQNWCYDRLSFQTPQWYQKLFHNFTIDNKFISFSYLIASKKVTAFNSDKIRIIGSSQKQKGKTIQMVCRNEELEFFSWLKKNKNFRFLPHGSLVSLPYNYEKKGNEIRWLNQD